MPVRLDKTYRLATRCPTCQSPFWRADLSDAGDAPVWRCENCGHVRERKVQRSASKATAPSPAQRAEADRFMARALHHLCPAGAENGLPHECKYEVKKHEEKFERGQLSVSFEVGMKNDEGTAAAVFCRDHYLWFFGRHGGARSYDSKKQRMVVGQDAFFAGRM